MNGLICIKRLLGKNWQRRWRMFSTGRNSIMGTGDRALSRWVPDSQDMPLPSGLAFCFLRLDKRLPSTRQHDNACLRKRIQALHWLTDFTGIKSSQNKLFLVGRGGLDTTGASWFVRCITCKTDKW